MQRISKTHPQKLLTIISEMCEKSLWFVEIGRLKKVDEFASCLAQFTRLIPSSHWFLSFHKIQPSVTAFLCENDPLPPKDNI